MARQAIRTPASPQSPLFSQAIKVGSTRSRTNQVAGPTIQEQTRQALVNCESILRAAGAKLENVFDVLAGAAALACAAASAQGGTLQAPRRP
jgi:2-iminobutanoate/2-iminopropanoate deaminase